MNRSRHAQSPPPALLSRRLLLIGVAGSAAALAQACAPAPSPSPVVPATKPAAAKSAAPVAAAADGTVVAAARPVPTHAPATPRPMATVKLGLPAPLFWQGPLALGIAKGIFEQRRINLQLANFDRSDLSIKALLTGEVDMGSFNAPGQLAAIGEGAELKVVGSINPGNPYVLAVRNRIQKWEDLYSYPVGISGFGTYPHIASVALFVKHGLDPDRMTWANVGGAAAGFAALQAGKAESMAVASEFLPRIEEDPNLRVLAALSEDLADLLPAVVSLNARFAKDSRDRAVDCLAGMMECVTYAMAHKDEFIEEEMPRLGKDRDEVEWSYDWYIKNKIWSPTLALTESQLDFTAQMNAKVLKNAKLVPVQSYFDPAFQQDAAKLVKP